MEEVIVLLNFNEYLGGGETLMVRFSEYLKKNKINFLVFCPTNSYTHSDLQKKNIDKSFIKTTSLNPNYYYLSESKRKDFLDDIKAKIGNQSKVRFVTFALRELYTTFDISKEFEKCSITHLILHPQDHLFLGETIIDKFFYKMFLLRNFSHNRIIKFNQKLLFILHNNNSLISMSEIINIFWKRSFEIKIPDSLTVPLPSFKVLDLEHRSISNNKIIWIGRLVDFKIPSIIAMINFISNQNKYDLSIVGEGDIKKIQDYLYLHKLETKRIHFLGKVPYDKLGDVIQKHSIGYAMGTSLIELVKYKIPVIVALASLDHRFFENQICGGLFFDKSKGYDGTELINNSPKNIKTTIKATIKEIELDYDKVSQNCYDYAKNNFSEDENFSKYLEIIQNSNELNRLDKKTKIPRASFLRNILYKIFQNNEI